MYQWHQLARVCSFCLDGLSSIPGHEEEEPEHSLNDILAAAAQMIDGYLAQVLSKIVFVRQNNILESRVPAGMSLRRDALYRSSGMAAHL